MSSLCLTTLRFALTARSTIKRTRNQTALSKFAHRLLYQFRKLVIYSKLFRSLQNEQAHCVFSVFLNQWRKWRFEPGDRNLAESGPVATEGEKKGEKWVFPDVDVYTKTGKHCGRRKKATIYWKQRVLYLSKWEPCFTFRLPGKAALDLATLVSYTTQS